MSDSRNDVTAKVLDLARALIRIPSRAGIDPVDPIVRFIKEWCDGDGIPARLLVADGKEVGVTARLSAGEGPSLCLDACADTAPFGDEAKWRHAPTSATVDEGRLYGRGAADSKIAVALFLVLASELVRDGALARGTLHLLFDADEHTGEFRGVKEFVREVDRTPDAVWIGYPGNQTIIAGSRGFLRARATVAGISAHTGGKSRKGVSAISRAARLISALERASLPAEPDPEFQFGPSLTITAITGGEGFSVVPDRCELNIDSRLTPNVGADQMRAFIEGIVRECDAMSPEVAATSLSWEESWPAYRTRDEEPAIASLRHAGSEVFGRNIPTTVSGPSNIGNYLASFGVRPMSGFGVTYDNLHATDEWCEIASIGPVYDSYRRAVLAFLAT